MKNILVSYKLAKHVRGITLIVVFTLFCIIIDNKKGEVYTLPSASIIISIRITGWKKKYHTISISYKHSTKGTKTRTLAIRMIPKYVLTIFIHSHAKAFLQSASLTLIPVSFVHYTSPCPCLTPSNKIKNTTVCR